MRSIGLLRRDAPRNDNTNAHACRPVADPRGRGAARLPVVPAAGGVSARMPRRAPRLVERPGSGIRRSRGVAGDRRPRARQARRQPHGPPVHRRLCRRAALRDPAEIRREEKPLAEGEYRADPADGLRLKRAIILNAVKCLPPANKPEPGEIATCRTYLEAGLATLTNVRVVVALGQIAHVAAARALGQPPSSTKFGHGAENPPPDRPNQQSSYHCSRYNQNTGRLDAAMFESVFERALSLGGTI